MKEETLEYIQLHDTVFPVLASERSREARRVFSRANQAEPAVAGFTPALRLVSAFRTAVMSLAALGLSVGIIFDLEWLFWLSVAIGFEETLETTVIIAALRDGKRLQALQLAKRQAVPQA